MAILKVMSLKIKKLQPMATINMHIKFQTEIPKQAWLMFWKPYLQMDRWTYRQVESSIPPQTSLGRGIIIAKHKYTALAFSIVRRKKVTGKINQLVDELCENIPSLHECHPPETYGSMGFHRTGNGVNLSGGCGVTASSARICVWR